MEDKPPEGEPRGMTPDQPGQHPGDHPGDHAGEQPGTQPAPLPVKAYQRAPTLLAGSSSESHGQVRVWAPRPLLLIRVAGLPAFVMTSSFLIAGLMTLVAFFALFGPAHEYYVIPSALLGLFVFGGAGRSVLRGVRRLLRPLYITTDDDGMALPLTDGKSLSIRWDSITLARKGYGWTSWSGQITRGHPYIILHAHVAVTIWLVGYSKSRREELFSLITRRAQLQPDFAYDAWRSAPERQALPRPSARRPVLAVRWSQLTPPAQGAFEAAEQQARNSGPTLVSPEHLLAGLAASPDSKIASLLAEHGIDEGDILAMIEPFAGSGGTPSADPVGLSVRLKEVLLLAAEQAGKSKTTPEQLLLAIARQRGGAASDLLLAHGLGPVRLGRRLELWDRQGDQDR